MEPPLLLVERYDIEAEIGRGANAVVYRAVDRKLGATVAVKLLREDVVSPHVVERFHQEMRVSAELDHPHILRVFDTGTADGRPFIVMELYGSQSLGDRLAADGQLPIDEALAIGTGIGEALAYAHQRGVVHRDVKPDNILLGVRGAVLADFGIARVTMEGISRQLTSTGIAVGTVQYMSPEQLVAERAVDGRSDQYALACVLYEMLAGVRPHIAATIEGLRALRMMERHVSVRAHRPHVPLTVDGAVHKALSSMMADRFSTMDAFVTALNAPPSTAEMAASAAARRRKWLPVAGVVAVASIVVAIALANGNTSSSAGDDGSVSISLTGASRTPDATSARLVNVLQTEMASWPDIRLNARGASPPLVLRPSASRVGDSVRIAIEVEGKPGRVTRVVAVADFDSGAAFATPLVRDVIASSLGGAPPGLDELTARSARAVTSYVRGYTAMLGGQLDSAVVRYREAAASAGTFAHASFWAAQVGSWMQPRNSVSWKNDAEMAARAGTLHGADSANAIALIALSRLDHAAMCDAYLGAAGLDPTAFVPRFGLGECRRLDTVVVHTRKGWQFRSSQWATALAFGEAIELAPSSELLAILFPRVMSATYAMGNRFRTGIGTDVSRTAFSAFPSLAADTIAFEPIPWAEFNGMGDRSIPSTWIPALRRGRQLATSLTHRWLTRWPSSSDAWFYRAYALELAGELGNDSNEETAIGALTRAARGAKSPVERARVAVAKTRLELRRGDFARAAHIADSALIGGDTLGSSGVLLAPLAALIGEQSLAERLARLDRQVDASIPAEIGDSIRAFRLRATLGSCDGLERQRTTIEQLFRVRFTPAELGAARVRLLQDGFREAIPCLGPSLAREFVAVNPLDTAYIMLANGDRAAARESLARLRSRRTGATIGAITWEMIFVESWALLQAGDSAVARSRLVGAFDDLANMSMYTLDHVAQAAGLRRALSLLDSIRINGNHDGAVQKWSERGKVLTRARPGGQR
jgi:serine/threonine-protein kinase